MSFAKGFYATSMFYPPANVKEGTFMLQATLNILLGEFLTQI